MENEIKSLIYTLCEYIFKNFNDSFGSFKASPSTNPNYIYHWVRDSCLIVDILLKFYNKGFIKPSKFITFLESFISFEEKTVLKADNYLSNLGEPKYNIDSTPFNDDWGRPQNDGPALRCLVYLSIIDSFPYYKSRIEKLLCENIKYIKKNIKELNFDLWEEVYGLHYYTLYLQLIVLLKTNQIFYNYEQIEYIKQKLNCFIKNDIIVSSIETKDKKTNKNDCYNRIFLDTSLIMSFLHSNTDPGHWLPYCEKVLNILEIKFNKIYKINSETNIDWYGRYIEDTYYGGNPWIICTLAKLSFQYKYNLKNKIYIHEQFNKIINHIKLLKDDPEQIDRNDGSSLSARFLTWNYVETLRLIDLLFL